MNLSTDIKSMSKKTPAKLDMETQRTADDMDIE
jgi:hypothetical protein